MLISALIFGLLGSFHCVGMCGPIAFLLPVDRQSNWKKTFQIGSYHLGRILAYASIGLLFGLVGSSLNFFGFQQELSIIIGILMLLMAFIPGLNPERLGFSKNWMKFIGGVKNKLGRELKKKRPETFFLVGFLNGYLPCGLVYMAFFGAMVQGQALSGALYMAIFGLGTIPLMTTAILAGNFISGKVRQHIRKVIPGMLAVIAVFFILRGLGLGIPYISPAEGIAIPQVASEMSCH